MNTMLSIYQRPLFVVKVEYSETWLLKLLRSEDSDFSYRLIINNE